MVNFGPLAAEIGSGFWLYYKNATHQLTNVTETHDKKFMETHKIMYENARTCLRFAI